MVQGLIAGGFALVCALGALWVGQPFRRSVLLALSVVSLGSALVSRLAVPHGPLWTVVAIAVAVLAVFGALALAALLVADGLLLIRSQGAAPPQSAALAVGTGLAALAALTVLTVCCSGGHPLVVVCLVLDAPAAYLALLFVLFLGHAALSGRLRPRRSADYVVVLGAGVVDGEVSPLLASRLDRGLTAYGALLARGCRPTVITSGGRGPDEERSEAEAMAAYLVARGVPGDCVRREDRSRNTGENLANSARIMRHADPRYRCTVITSDFHAFRTALLMRRLGVRGSAAGAWTAPSYWLAAALREFVAVLKGDPPMPSSLSSTALATGTAPHTPEAIEPAPSRQGGGAVSRAGPVGPAQHHRPRRARHVEGAVRPPRGVGGGDARVPVRAQRPDRAEPHPGQVRGPAVQDPQRADGGHRPGRYHRPGQGHRPVRPRSNQRV